MSNPPPADDEGGYPLADMLGRLGAELKEANERVVQAGRQAQL